MQKPSKTVLLNLLLLVGAIAFFLVKHAGNTDEVAAIPLTSVISGMFLLGFCIVYLKHLNSYRFGLVIFLYFLLTRLDILLAPHYTVAVTEYFPGTIFLYHLIVFACSASIISLFREMLRKFLDEKTALFGALVLLSLPLFQGMSETLNLEMLCTFFAIKSVYFIDRRKLFVASLTAILSLLVKTPGGIICATVFLTSVLLFFCKPKNKHRIGFLIAGTTALIAAVIKLIALYHTVKFLAGWPQIKAMPAFWIFSICVLLMAVHAFYQIRKGADVRTFLSNNASAIAMALAGIFWFLLYLNFPAVGYHNELLLAPFFVFCIIKVIKGTATFFFPAKLFVI